MLFENPYSHTNVGALRRNSQGFVAEVDEEFLDAWLKEKGDSYGFGDSDYQDSPDDDIEEILQRLTTFKNQDMWAGCGRLYLAQLTTPSS